MIEIRQIRKEDDTSLFHSADLNLDLYLKQYAKQNQFKHYIGTTYVALIKERIVGYVSVSAGSIRAGSLSKTLSKRLPKYPLPILRITRLAVDESFAGCGIGKALVRFVMELSLRQKEQFGCFGLVVDAKKGSEGFYEQFGFEIFEAIIGRLDIRPYAASMFLPLKIIEKAKA